MGGPALYASGFRKGWGPSSLRLPSSLRSILQNHHPTPNFARSMDIASVIVTFMVTYCMLTRFILDNRSEQRCPVAQLCFPVTPLEATLPRFSASVHSKGLTAKLSPLEATLTKKPGGPPSPNYSFLLVYPERVRRGPLVYPDVEGPLSSVDVPLPLPLSSRWSPVVFQREMPSISFLFMSLPDSSHQNEGGYTPTPLLVVCCPPKFRCLASFMPGEQP